MGRINSTNSTEKLFDPRATRYVLGCLRHKPILREKHPEINVNREAFFAPGRGLSLSVIVFHAVIDLLSKNCRTRIVPNDVNAYIEQDIPEEWDYYNANNGQDYVANLYKRVDGTDRPQFESSLGIVKKLGALRRYKEDGFSIDKYYNPDDILGQAQEQKNLKNLKLHKITEDYRSKIAAIEAAYNGQDSGSSSTIGYRMDDLIDSLQKSPEMGYNLDGAILNSVTRGARLGKLYVYSAPSGHGKTRFLVDNAVKLSRPTVKDVIANPALLQPDDKFSSLYHPICYIATEQQRDEIQTLVLAAVSGIPEETILLGMFTQDKNPSAFAAIEKAKEIIKKYGSNFRVDCIPDPSIAMIKTRFANYANQGIQYRFYDYIFSSPGLISEFSSSAIREDVALRRLANSLKEIAMTHNVFVRTATQLNDGWAMNKTSARDQNCIRGSKAIADKVDIGRIGVKISNEEFDKVKMIVEDLCHNSAWVAAHPRTTPNVVIDLYKNRRGKFSGIKIFRYFDYATCHGDDLFRTDSNYQRYPIENEATFDLVIKGKDGNNGI